MNKRLTTDEPLTNVETALNLFYNEYGQTWVLDGGPAPDYYDVSLYDYARRLIKAHGSKIDTDVEDIELGNTITDCLLDGPETIDGLIATLYTAAWAFAELRQKLKEYEDAEERGLLIHLPYVPDKDIESIHDLLYDTKADWVHDPSVGLFGPNEGEDALYAKIPDIYPGIHEKNDRMCEITGKQIKDAPTIIPAEEADYER